AGLGPAAEAVSQALATRLGLGLPALPWHADRARMAQVGFELALAAGVCAKIATDVLLLSQAELGELREGGAESPSSAMPHKRNAGQAVMIRAAWQRVPGLAASLLAAMTPELDRGAGSWQGDSTTLGELLRLTGGAAQRLVRLLEGLEVDGARMAANLERFAGEAIAEGLAAALTLRLGRERALGLAAEIAQEPAAGRRRRLEQELDSSGEISEVELDQLLSPARHLGDASRLIDRALALADERGLG
ncbi:MAG: lyase family protein, partial [Candidatus Dormibacteria bacterium]